MFPIKYIDNNLVWNKDNEVFAYYELIPYNYSFLSAEQKFIVHDSFRQLIASNVCKRLCADGIKVFAVVKDENENIGESETEDKDWINNWKQYFKPFTVDHILIKPTWETVPEEHKDKLLIQIDPGTAFGTGMHETTQLCIRQLEKYVTPDSEVLDVGTGSGILGITALKLGAKHVFGTDLDENAITAVGENLEANGIAPEQFKVVQGNIIDDKAVQDEVKYE